MTRTDEHERYDMKQQMTPEQRAARIERRAAIRATVAGKRDELRQDRQAESRGVDRVPAHLHGAEITYEPHLFGKRDVDHARPLAQPEDLHPSGNHADRRAQGQRGHQRKPRRRELPGAAQRRLERRRKAWLT